MIRTRIYVKNINYNSLIKLMMPYMEKWLSEKDNIFLDILSKIISKKGRPTKFSELLVSLVPRKDDLAAVVLYHFDDVMVEYLNHLLTENSITAQITKIRTDTIERNHKTMIRIIMDIDHIDYETTIENLLPEIIHRLSEMEDNSGRIGTLLLEMKELPLKVLKAAVGEIPAEERDKLVATILTEYKVELRDTLNNLISKNNIKAEINAVKIENHPDNI